MIGLPANTRVWIVAGHTDMRKGFDGLAAVVQTRWRANPFCGPRLRLPRPARRHPQGAVVRRPGPDAAGQAAGARPLRLAAGHIGRVALTPAQLSMLLEGIDWRMPVRTHAPELGACVPT
jgi:transposase